MNSLIFLCAAGMLPKISEATDREIEAVTRWKQSSTEDRLLEQLNIEKISKLILSYKHSLTLLSTLNDESNPRVDLLRNSQLSDNASRILNEFIDIIRGYQ